MFASLALALITCAKAPPAERPSARAAEAPSVTEAPAVPVVAQGGPVVVRAVVAEVSAFGDDPRDAWALVDGSAERALAGDGGPVTLRVRFERPERLETVTVRGPYDLTSAEPTVAYDYAVGTSLATAPYWVRVRNKDSAHPGDPVETVIFVDGLGRVIQTKQDAEVDDGTGSTLVGRTVSGPVTFDHRGRPARVGQPVFDGGPVGSLTTFLTVPEVHATVTAYDVVSRTTAVTDPAGASVQTVYTTEALDGVTRLAATTVDPVGHERTVFTDVRGATVAVRERNTIDGVLTALVTRYTHDPLGRLTKVVDAQGHGTDAVYDSRGLMVSLDNPDTGLVTWRYTLAGDLAWRQTPVLRAEGEAITYARTFHRLDRVEYPHSAPVEHAYGAPGAAYNAAGRLVSTTDASGTTSYRYGALGEVTHTTHALVAMGSAPALTAVVKHTYDSFGRVQSIAYPDGADVTYEYDAGGRLRRVLGTRNGSSFTYVDRVTYTEFGERRSIRYGNGVETTYQYDPARRWLSSLNTLSGSGLPLQQVGYGLRADGNITAMWGATAAVPGVSAGGSFYQGFTYDDLNQLTDAVGYFWNAESSRQYAFSQRYDAIGNVTSKAQDDWLTAAPTWMGEAQSATTYAQSYAYGGVRPHAPTVVGSRSFSYDADGNQTGWSDALTSASRTITWDEEDRVTEVSTGGVSVTFRYNGDGQRTHKVSSGATSVYVGGLYTVRNGVVGTRHVYAGDQRIASTVLPDGMAAATENTHFYHPNHLQSTHLVTNDAGAVTEHTEYFPFGETWIDESSASERVAYRFTGKELDAETGLYYFGARYYDPRQSQWISADPILRQYVQADDGEGVYVPENLAMYSYGWNSPLIVRDPNGQFNVRQFVSGFGTGVVGGIAAQGALRGTFRVLRIVAGRATGPIAVGVTGYMIYQSAGQIPALVSGRDAQGNVIGDSELSRRRGEFAGALLSGQVYRGASNAIRALAARPRHVGNTASGVTSSGAVAAWLREFGRAENATGEYQGGGLAAAAVGARTCGRDAVAIANHLGPDAEIVALTPPADANAIGGVTPPAGGRVQWDMHYFVRWRGRIYDRMTGPKGMSEELYSRLFEYWRYLQQQVTAPEAVRQ